MKNLAITFLMFMALPVFGGQFAEQIAIARAMAGPAIITSVVEKPEIKWTTLQEAALAKKPTIVYIHSNGCPSCVAIENGPFKNIRVIRAMKRFVCVRLPFADAGDWKVRSVPTFVLVSSDWKKQQTRQGPTKTTDLLNLLNDFEKLKR